MTEPSRSSSPQRWHWVSAALVGCLVGAGTGALLRFLIAVGFVSSVSKPGGFWQGSAEVMYEVARVSALIGLLIGGSAGMTCKPVLGALLGGGLSGASCLCFIVLPTGMMLSMSGGRKPSHPQENGAIFVGLFAMTLAGIAAGGVGAFAGSWRKRVLEQDEP